MNRNSPNRGKPAPKSVLAAGIRPEDIEDLWIEELADNLQIIASLTSDPSLPEHVIVRMDAKREEVIGRFQRRDIPSMMRELSRAAE
ncbi:hypothetical protein J8273_1017 [Carpediemonas membranifera]|uniref:Uncharacterized protein n=1 Tax=Carpediemonas membranifera TaxID=201153 RepID=A0A8J6BB78_9EUKA|nr:hypothetical protein J8273_1017 [Carpediemonas membranifera]|eukprot:KAG9397109.1 hypothetical protein J8273_1017 [Carpediemonas membranifera]